MTLADYAVRWLQDVKQLTKPRTVDNYERTLRLHLTPRLGAIPLPALTRSQVRGTLLELLRAGMAPAYVRVALAVVRAMLSAAVEEELLAANPALGVGRTLKLGRRHGEADEIRAMDASQLTRFLEAAGGESAYGLFLLMARTGLRVGEALGVQWRDVNEDERWVRVERTWVDNGSWQAGERHLPKSGNTRTVDLSAELTAFLRAARLAATRTAPECPWLFANPCTGLPWARQHVAHAMRRVLQACGLPATFTPHSLRHTYASLLLSRGEPAQYVQRQLGHASIELTVGTYGRWLPMRRLTAVDSLDTPPAAPRARDAGDAAGRLVVDRAADDRDLVDNARASDHPPASRDDGDRSDIGREQDHAASVPAGAQLVADTLRAARRAIARPSRWCRNTAAVDAFGTPLAVEEQHQAAATCAIGALWTVDVSPQDRVDAFDVLEAVAEELLLERGRRLPQIGHSLVEVNDDLGHDDVLLVFDRAIDQAEAGALEDAGTA
jgi:integrase